MTDKQAALVKQLVTAVMAIVLLSLMTWIVLSPHTSEEIAKAALVICGTAVGFIFGRESAR